MEVQFNFEAGDTVWIINPVDKTIKRGEVLQANSKSFDNAEGDPETIITYLVLLENSEGTDWVADDEIFATYLEAVLALADDYVPPVPTPSVTPTISLTPSVTVTPTITPSPSVTVSITPTPTPSVTVTPTITPTVTVTPTPSVTPSVTGTSVIAPSPTPTVTPTTTVTPTITPTPSVVANTFGLFAGFGAGYATLTYDIISNTFGTPIFNNYETNEIPPDSFDNILVSPTTFYNRSSGDLTKFRNVGGQLVDGVILSTDLDTNTNVVGGYNVDSDLLLLVEGGGLNLYRVETDNSLTILDSLSYAFEIPVYIAYGFNTFIVAFKVFPSDSNLMIRTFTVSEDNLVPRSELLYGQGSDWSDPSQSGEDFAFKFNSTTNEGILYFFRNADLGGGYGFGAFRIRRVASSTFLNSLSDVGSVIYHTDLTNRGFVIDNGSNKAFVYYINDDQEAVFQEMIFSGGFTLGPVFSITNFTNQSPTVMHNGLMFVSDTPDTGELRVYYFNALNDTWGQLATTILEPTVEYGQVTADILALTRINTQIPPVPSPTPTPTVTPTITPTPSTTPVPFDPMGHADIIGYWTTADSGSLWTDTGGTTPATNEDDPVNRIDDQIGSNHFTGAGVSPPLLKDAAQPNRYLQFDDGGLATLGQIDYEGSNDLTIVMYGAPTNDDVSGINTIMLESGSSYASEGQYAILPNYPHTGVIFGGLNDGNFQAAPTFFDRTIDQTMTFIWNRDSGTIQAYINGILTASGDGTGAGTFANAVLNLGSRTGDLFPTPMRFYALAVFNVALTFNERVGIESYLRGQFS